MSSKPTTIKEIAKILKISASTVSRALNDHSSIGLTTKARVKQLAKELNYEPNQKAIYFLKGKSFTLGVILPELSESFFSEAISGIEDVAYKRNYTVILAQSHDDEEKEKKLVEKMKNQRVDGLLISISKNTKSYEHFDMLKRLNIPIIFFDRVPPIKNIHSVVSNLETGTFEAVNYLLKKGHRTIAMINGPNTLLASNERKEGYIKAITSNRLKFDPSMIVNCNLTEEGTIEALDTLLSNKRKPTALVTFNDYVSLYAIRHARSLGIKINEELDIVSYANLPIINYMDYTPMASVEQFPYLQGQKAADILLDILNKPDLDINADQAYYNIVVESKFIVNEKYEKKQEDN